MPKARAVIEAVLEGKKYREIAPALHITTSHCSTLKKQGIEYMRQRLVTMEN